MKDSHDICHPSLEEDSRREQCQDWNVRTLQLNHAIRLRCSCYNTRNLLTVLGSWQQIETCGRGWQPLRWFRYTWLLHISFGGSGILLLTVSAKVVALEHCNARLHTRRIPLWDRGTVLVCCWMQPHDCLLCATRHLLQAEDSWGTHTTWDRSHKIW